MADSTSGFALAAILGGSVFLYAGVRGVSILKSLQAVIQGKSPTTVTPTQGITGLDLSVTTAADVTSSAKPNASGMVNPIGPGLTRGRIDEGVDFSGSGPLFAIGGGTIKEVTGSGWPGGVFILLALDGGQFVYYAENITPTVSVGQRVKAGDLIGHAHNAYPFIEIGWGSGAPQTAAASGHYTEGVPTAEGKSFAALLTQLGAP